MLKDSGKPWEQPARDPAPERQAWDSSLVGLWTIESPGLGGLVFAGTAAAALVLPAGLALMLGWIARGSGTTGLVLAGLLVALGVFNYLRIAVRVMLRPNDPYARSLASSRAAVLSLALGGWMHIVTNPVAGIVDGFGSGATRAGAWDWARFYALEVTDMLLFDVPEAMGWQWSAIEPTSTSAVAAVAVFQVLVGLGIFEVILWLWNMLMRRRHFFGTLRDCWVRADRHLDLGAEVCLHGVVRPLDPILECRAADFVAAFDEAARPERSALRRRDEREEL